MVLLLSGYSSSQCRGEYGGEVMQEARPLPLEYLIVELTTTSPIEPQPLLPGGRAPSFPVENRTSIGQLVQVRWDKKWVWFNALCMTS